MCSGSTLGFMGYGVEGVGGRGNIGADSMRPDVQKVHKTVNLDFVFYFVLCKKFECKFLGLIPVCSCMSE